MANPYNPRFETQHLRLCAVPPRARSERVLPQNQYRTFQYLFGPQPQYFPLHQNKYQDLLNQPHPAKNLKGPRVQNNAINIIAGAG